MKDDEVLTQRLTSMMPSALRDLTMTKTAKMEIVMEYLHESKCT